MIGVMAAAALAASGPGPQKAAPASSPPKAASAHVIKDPHWLTKPTEDEIAEFYPVKAESEGLAGHATIHCFLTPDGTTRDCRATAEMPPGEGFGDAAAALMLKQHLYPRTIDGKPVDGEITVNIGFQPSATIFEAQSLEQSEVCIAYAKARLEVNPAQRDAWGDLLFWDQMISSAGATQKLKPSQIDAEIDDSMKVAGIMLAGGDMSTVESCRSIEQGVISDSVKAQAAEAAGKTPAPSKPDSPGASR